VRTNAYRIASTLIGALWLAGCDSDPTPAPPPSSTSTLESNGVVGLGRIESGRGLIAVGAPVSGVVAQVAVTIGDTVRSGDVLVRLNSTVAEAELAAAEATIRFRREQIPGAEARFRQAQVRQAASERIFASTANLTRAGASPDEDEARDRDTRDVAAAELAEARAAVAAARAELTRATADAGVARARVRDRRIVAPISAVVLRVEVRPGEAASANAPLIDLAPLGARIARCELDELLALDAGQGDSAIVRSLARDSVLGAGRVTLAAPSLVQKSLFSGTAGEPEDRRVREVWVELLSGQPPFNARVECVVLTRRGRTP
jgi:multidrug efflux pump subunit AcrA (membrane-fusion protein)